MRGSFSDVALPELLQTLCSSRRRARLSLRQSGEEGTICIERGNISHAAIGSLTGEAAFYRLLTWKSATFRTGELLELNERTIAKPWRQLLMEGAVHLDEAPRGGSAPPDRSADWALEEKLLDLLAGCEGSLQDLRGSDARRQPVMALAILQGLLDRLVAAAPRVLGEGPAAAEPFWQAHATEPATPLEPPVEWREGRVSLSAAIRLYRRWPTARAQRGSAFHNLCQKLVTALERYLALPAARFGSAEVAASWQGTYRLFLEELATCLEAVEF